MLINNDKLQGLNSQLAGTQVTNQGPVVRIQSSISDNPGLTLNKNLWS